MEKPPRKVRVVRVKGKELLLEELRSLLSNFSYSITYDTVEDEGVVYKYEELHVTGQVSDVYIAITCDHERCEVEAPIYKYGGVEPCYCRPDPNEVVDCIKTIAGSVANVKSVVGNLQAMARELEQHGFQVDLLGTGAEAYYSLGRNSYIRVHLSARASVIQLQLQADPARIVELAKRLVELIR